MGCSSSLYLVEITACLEGWILTEPVLHSTWSDQRCFVSSGVSGSSPGSAACYSVTNTARGA